MMQEVDTALFRLVNQSMSNPFLDWFLNIFNGGLLFKQLAIVAGILAAIKGGTRGRLCLLFVILAVAIGDGLVCGKIKKTVARPRPFMQLEDVKLITGKGSSGSMPSSHAANSMAMAIVVATFYRRSRWIVFPIAGLVCLARVYSGVHFPSDVIAGALLAWIYTPLILYGAQRFWRTMGPRIAPNFAERLPSLLQPEEVIRHAPSSEKSFAWLTLGWYLIGITLVLRLIYIGGGKIELSEDEAYQWMWSKHLALSYYSKPPLIAYAQWLGTSIFGDTEFGIRWLSPILAAISASALMLLLARNFNERAAFFTIAALCAMPLPAVGATLMTIDALSVCFWTLAFVAAWKAIQKDSLGWWALTGVAVAFGLLAKYVALFQWPVLFLYLFLCARDQFRKPGLYVAILISLLALLPVIIWNQQNGWITLTHLSERSGLDQGWKFQFRFIGDFWGAELGLLNPVFFVLMMWAAIHFWKTRTPFQTFLFCMGGPLFIGYALYTLRARVQPNWIAPSILPLVALAATFWEPLWNRRFKPFLHFGFGLGLVVVVLLHDTNLTDKLMGFWLPAKLDPLRRVRAWSPIPEVVEKERAKLAAEGNKNAFIIGGHYGVTSLMTFYTPETRKNPRDNKLIYALASDLPHNQYYFWRNYLERVGENAIFVQRADSRSGVPEELVKQFESVEDLGEREILYRNRVFHTVRLYACKNLRPQASARR